MVKSLPRDYPALPATHTNVVSVGTPSLPTRHAGYTPDVLSELASAGRRLSSPRPRGVNGFML
eukprot:12900312-Prorocentrum_lima.AAC.1